eukprot:PhM_4_TR8054/c0_g1_i1/m.30625
MVLVRDDEHWRDVVLREVHIARHVDHVLQQAVVETDAEACDGLNATAAEETLSRARGALNQQDAAGIELGHGLVLPSVESESATHLLNQLCVRRAVLGGYELNGLVFELSIHNLRLEGEGRGVMKERAHRREHGLVAGEERRGEHHETVVQGNLHAHMAVALQVLDKDFDGASVAVSRLDGHQSVIGHRDAPSEEDLTGGELALGLGCLRREEQESTDGEAVGRHALWMWREMDDRHNSTLNICVLTNVLDAVVDEALQVLCFHRLFVGLVLVFVLLLLDLQHALMNVLDELRVAVGTQE